MHGVLEPLFTGVCSRNLIVHWHTRRLCIVSLNCIVLYFRNRRLSNLFTIAVKRDHRMPMNLNYVNSKTNDEIARANSSEERLQHSMHKYRQYCVKYFQKVFQLQITFLKVFQLLLSITLDKWPKIQNTLTRAAFGVIASQSINEYSFNKQEKHTHISRLGIGTVTVTVQCMVNKEKH